MLLALAMVLALAPPPAKAPPKRVAKPIGVVIWGGGATKAAGEAALADAKAHMPRDVVATAGYPKLVESKEVPGLKPGFFVALVGVCTSARGNAVVSRLRETKDGVYQRRVASPKPAHPALAIACPKVAKRAADEGPTMKLGDTEVTLVTTREDSCADVEAEPDDGEPRSCSASETMTLIAKIDGVRRELWEQVVVKSSSDVECDLTERWDGPNVVENDVVIAGERLPRITFDYTRDDGCAGIYSPRPTDEEVEEERDANRVTLRFDGTSYTPAK